MSALEARADKEGRAWLESEAGCCWYEELRLRREGRKSEGEELRKRIRKRGRRVGIQAAMMMTFISMLGGGKDVSFRTDGTVSA